MAEYQLTANDNANTIVVPPEDRTFVVPAEDFTIVVPPESREIEVPSHDPGQQSPYSR